MKIYVSHKGRSNYKKELYEPLLNSGLESMHEFILPHQNNDKSFNARELFEKKQCDLVLAEVSEPATGQGIELGFASMYTIPIICIYKTGSDISGSLHFITNKFLEYNNTKDLINKLSIELKSNYA